MGSDFKEWKKPGTPAGEWAAPALQVLRERYLSRDGGTVFETPDDLCWRVAVDIASAETPWCSPEEIHKTAQDFYRLLLERKFLPNSPTLMNAGIRGGLQYAACYVLPVEDSLEGIFEAVKRAAIIHQSGGGTGFSFSRLRPKGSVLAKSGGWASGPVSFLRVFDAATEAVKQGGRRRGANMGILRVDHPDILEFIDCKRSGAITNFNISAAVTDRFMQAHREGGGCELISPQTGRSAGAMNAREVFGKICEAAWATGDPGCLFIDRINAGPANPVPAMGPVEATNPCGEQPLYPNESCNLGSINVGLLTKSESGKTVVDLDELERVIRLAVRFLDDVVEKNPYPFPEIEANVKANRRIGLGVMGWADLLIRMEIPYASAEALDLAVRLMGFLKKIGHEESGNLARARGAFPNWNRSIYKDGQPLRNATVTTIAPTGSISIIADSSSGIEPLFALAFRHQAGPRVLDFVSRPAAVALQKRGLWTEENRRQILQDGKIGAIASIPKEIREILATAYEVAPKWHVKMQAAFQKHTDNAVSKTVNLPREFGVEDIRKIYLSAYEEGCSGITIYRDRSKESQVLSAGLIRRNSCPDCEAALLPGEGCLQCPVCGFSNC